MWIGSFADGGRYDASMGWFQSNVAFAAHEAVYWDFEAKRDKPNPGAWNKVMLEIGATSLLKVTTPWGGSEEEF